MMAPFCTSFSRARDRTKMIRSHRFPWGLPKRFLSPHEQESIRIGNSLFGACFRIIDCCLLHNIPWILENPLSSRCWNLPRLRQLQASPDIVNIHADFCQFGTAWKKPTLFLASRVDDVHRLSRVCRGSHGACSRTYKPHWLLTGAGPGGVPWTQLAEPYPTPLCRALAHVLTSQYHTTNSLSSQ